MGTVLAGYTQDGLLDAMKNAIAGTVPHGRIGVAFSGGVDSALVSKVCSAMHYDVTLLTVGFSESHDVLFAKKAGGLMGLPHHTLEIDPATFGSVHDGIRASLDTDNLSWLENCIAFHYVSMLAESLGVRTVVTANGIDELFCGYDAYRRIFQEGEQGIARAMNEKLQNEIRLMREVGRVSSEFGISVVQPLLSEEFAAYAGTVPIREKILGPDDLLRKHAIRDLARRAGVPHMSCVKRKKALQYGTRIHKAVLKSR